MWNHRNWGAAVMKSKRLNYRPILKEISPKGNQSWIFIVRTDAEAKTPILGPPDAKNWLIGKDPDAGKDWRREEKGTTEDEMVGWPHRLNGHEFEQAPGVGDGQGGLACCSPWGHKESDTTDLLNWTEQASSMACLGNEYYRNVGTCQQWSIQNEGFCFYKHSDIL